MNIKPLNQQPRYGATLKELNELSNALAKVQGRIAEIDAMLVRRDPDKDAGRVAAALAFAETGEVRLPEGTALNLSQERQALVEQQAALTKAVVACRNSLDAINQDLSHQVCKEFESSHRALARKYLNKLLELDAIAEEERAFFEELERSGYSVSFREYVQWHVIGSLRDISSAPIWYRVRDLKTYAN